MNRLYWIVALVVLCVPGFGEKAFGQIVQYGKVVEKNSHGKAMPGVYVEVKSAHDCQPTSSDAHGVFRLDFRSHQIGDTVHVTASKYNYEVVNIHVTRDAWTLTDRDTLRIVMAPQNQIKEARMRYYGLVEATCIARFDSTMNLLDVHYANHSISTPEYQYWKMAAESELHRAYRNMDYYADAFARANEDDGDAATLALFAKLNANDIEGAMALVDKKPQMTVLQAYTEFTATFPMVVPEQPVANIETNPIPDDDSLYESIIVLQTYADLFEGEFATSGAKYAKSCAYLGILYQEKGWDEASRKYLTRALRMYEMLNLLDGNDYEREIAKMKQLLENH